MNKLAAFFQIGVCKTWISASPGDAASHPKDKKALREEVICLDDSSTSVGEEGSKSDGPISAPAERTHKTGQGFARGSPVFD